MDFVKFSDTTTPVKMQGITGLVNGYKILEILHAGERVNLRAQTYYYIPAVNSIVTYRASGAKLLTISRQNRISLRQAIGGGFAKTINVDASMMYTAAKEKFR